MKNNFLPGILNICGRVRPVPGHIRPMGGARSPLHVAYTGTQPGLP